MSRARDSASRSGHPQKRVARRAPTSSTRQIVRDPQQEAERRLAQVAAALSAKDAGGIDPETQSLLLRQLAVTRFEAGDHEAVLEIASRIVRLGVLPDLGHHEAARVYGARGQHLRAAEEDMLAARAAPAERRAFFYWSRATHLEHAGEAERALDALRKASRWATDAGRPLFRAHAAMLRLDLGEAVPSLGAVVAALEACPQRDGYGQYVLARLARHIGEHGRASALFRAFVRRHESSGPAVRGTLAAELAHARQVLRANDRTVA